MLERPTLEATTLNIVQSSRISIFQSDSDRMWLKNKYDMTQQSDLKDLVKRQALCYTGYTGNAQGTYRV